MKTQHYYPSVPLSWARDAASLTPREVAYGIHQGLLNGAPPDEKLVRDQPWLAVVEQTSLASVRDLIFRLLLINLYKNWFLLDSPLRALEFLVLDFEDCPTAVIAHGKLLSGIAGISDADPPSELDPDYFEQKVRAFQFLTEFIIQIVREGIRTVST
jgi:hypothetical protein